MSENPLTIHVYAFSSMFQQIVETFKALMKFVHEYSETDIYTPRTTLSWAPGQSRVHGRRFASRFNYVKFIFSLLICIMHGLQIHVENFKVFNGFAASTCTADLS
jgi:hypothetical protein